MQNPTVGSQSSVPQTTVKMQNNSKGNQNAISDKGNPNTPVQATPNPNVIPKFSCEDCTFSCNSLQNFRIHLQTVHHKSSKSLQTLSALNKPVQEKPKGSTEVKAQPEKAKWSAVVEGKPVYYVQEKPIEVKAQPEKPDWSSVVEAKPVLYVQEKPKWSAEVKAQPEKPKWSAEVKAQPEKPKWSAEVKPLPEKPKWSMIVKPLPEKPKWNALVTAHPEKPKGSAEVKAQPEKPKGRVVVKALPEKPKGRVVVKALPEKPKGRVVVKALPEKPKWRPVVEAKPEKLKWKALGETQPEKPEGNVVMKGHSGTVPGSSGRNIAKLKDYIARADREPLIGLEYVLEYRFKTKGNETEIKYFCQLCECDTDVDPMVEHLAGFGHRKLYLAKEYPYVVKAQSKGKDQSQFIRRMALEIERDEGTKMYMIDPSIWMETMMTLRTADKKMRKKTRWDEDKNDQSRVKKALNFLNSFEIESEIEATTVSRLCEKLTANLKFYNTKSKEDALFPASVARAQDVAIALMRNAAKQRTPLQNPAQKSKPQMPPQLDKRPPNLPGNANLMHKVGMHSGFPGANFQNIMANQNMPKAPPYLQGQQYPFVPSNQKQAMQGPSMPKMKETVKTQSVDSFMKNIGQEDTQFFRKLMTLLNGLPQDSSFSGRSQMNSKLLMLKSLLVDQKNAEHKQANQKLMMQISSMVEDTISAPNASLNQQLMMLMTSQNRTGMAMQTASLRNNLAATDSMSTAGFVQGIQSSGNFGSQMYGQTGRTGLGQVDHSVYQDPQVDMQNFPSRSQNYPSTSQKYPSTSQNYPSASQKYPSASQNYPSTSQNYPSTSQNYPSTSHHRYRNSVEGNFSRQGEPYVSQRDGIANTLTAGQNKQTNIPYTKEPSVYGKELDNSYYSNPSTQVPESRYNDQMKKQASYTRVCLSPSSPQNLDDDYNKNTRGEIGIQDQRQQHSLRSYNSSDWDDQEDDMRYVKRARLDMDVRPDRSENYNNQSLESLGINTAVMPEELIKRIKGKDLFTASAIISEYSERLSGK